MLSLKISGYLQSRPTAVRQQLSVEGHLISQQKSQGGTHHGRCIFGVDGKITTDVYVILLLPTMSDILVTGPHIQQTGVLTAAVNAGSIFKRLGNTGRLLCSEALIWMELQDVFKPVFMSSVTLNIAALYLCM